jgi:hypothetical protein
VIQVLSIRKQILIVVRTETTQKKTMYEWFPCQQDKQNGCDQYLWKITFFFKNNVNKQETLSSIPERHYQCVGILFNPIPERHYQCVDILLLLEQKQPKKKPCMNGFHVNKTNRMGVTNIKPLKKQLIH